MAVNFTQALVNARRRASISGRPLSQQETAGIAAGEASTSSERAARLKSLRLQERQLAQQNEQFRKEQEFKEKQAEKEERTAMGSAVGTLVGAGAVVGGAVMGGWGAGVGMAALATPLGWGALAGGALLGGIFGGNTHLCTEASHVLGKIDNRHLRAYQKLRYYAKENLRPATGSTTIADRRSSPGYGMRSPNRVSTGSGGKNFTTRSSLPCWIFPRKTPLPITTMPSTCGTC
jgi:hypothetical protein